MNFTNRMFCAVMAALICGTVTPLQAQKDRALVCRGGSGLTFHVLANPSPLSKDYYRLVRMSLRYRPSTDPTITSSTRDKLAPGSCGYYGTPQPPGEVIFDVKPTAQDPRLLQTIDTSLYAAVSYPDSASVPRYLKNSDNYWVFYYSEDQSPPFSSSHSASMPVIYHSATVTANQPAPTKSPTDTPKVGRKVTAAAMREMMRELRLVRIDQSVGKFNILFTAGLSARATVLYSTDKPIREPSTGRWFFNNGSVQGSGAVEGGFRAEVREAQSANFSSYTAWNRLPIERGKTYNYIITVPRTTRYAEQQLTGQFTTIRQDVRVTINEIKVLQSTIPSADVRWHFWIGYPDGSGNSAADGGPQPAFLQNAPDRVRLLIAAGSRSGAPYSIAEVEAPRTWTAVPGHHSGVAKEEFDLLMKQAGRVPTSWPSGSYTRTVTVRSLPGEIVFDATATIEVIRR